MVLTFNEAPNIERTLRQLTWAKHILLIDSFSTDDTIRIVRRFPQVQVVQRLFDSFANQCNFGLQQIHTPWVLSLDADYVLSKELSCEISNFIPSREVMGLRVKFRYCVFGRALRASLYPPRVVLYRKERAKYENDGHGHRISIDGEVSDLCGLIFHDDRKPLSRWLGEQSRYAAQEAEKLMLISIQELNFPDRIRRKIVLAPILVLFYTLFGKRLIMDGWPGWFYVLQRVLAEMILSLKLIEAKLKPITDDPKNGI